MKYVWYFEAILRLSFDKCFYHGNFDIQLKRVLFLANIFDLCQTVVTFNRFTTYKWPKRMCVCVCFFLFGRNLKKNFNQHEILNKTETVHKFVYKYLMLNKKLMYWKSSMSIVVKNLFVIWQFCLYLFYRNCLVENQRHRQTIRLVYRNYGIRSDWHVNGSTLKKKTVSKHLHQINVIERGKTVIANIDNHKQKNTSFFLVYSRFNTKPTCNL